MDPIKEAFLKIKEDILFLKEEILQIKSELDSLKNQTIEHINPTNSNLISDRQTDKDISQNKNLPLESLSNQNINISTGNKGVPTDRQTDRQTNQQTQNTAIDEKLSDFKKANEILNSLDNIKKGIRIKFKRLTNQEMLVFSTLYSLQDQNLKEITYKILAERLNLSESSIRDYINKLINKGIPIEKYKKNNKTITLSISDDLRKITNLSTIINLRDLSF